MKIEFEFDEMPYIRSSAEQGAQLVFSPRGVAANRLCQMMRDFVASPEGEVYLERMMREAIERCAPELVEGVVRVKLKEYIRATAKRLEGEQALFSGFAAGKR